MNRYGHFKKHQQLYSKYVLYFFKFPFRKGFGSFSKRNWFQGSKYMLPFLIFWPKSARNKQNITFELTPKKYLSVKMLDSILFSSKSLPYKSTLRFVKMMKGLSYGPAKICFSFFGGPITSTPLICSQFWRYFCKLNVLNKNRSLGAFFPKKIVGIEKCSLF